MPIRVGWRDTEKRVIYIQFVAHWSPEEFWAMLTATNVLADTVDYHIAVLINLSDSQSIPNNMMALLRSATVQAHQRIGVMVAIGVSNMLERLAEASQKAYPSERRILLADDIDHAMAIITQHQVAQPPK